MSELLERWGRRAQELEAAGAPDIARILNQLLDEVQDTLDRAGEETVNLTEAASLGGYHPDTLGRMIREGQLENVGRRHAPKLRLRDVPVKPGRHGAQDALVSRWVRQQGRRRTS